MVRETGVQYQIESYQRLKKMVLDTPLLKTQHYNVRIKGKVEQSRERSSALPYTIEKGAFWSPSTTVFNVTYIFKSVILTRLIDLNIYLFSKLFV